MKLLPRGPWLAALVVAALAARGTDAGAWEAFCRDPSALQAWSVDHPRAPVLTGGRYANTMLVQSICADPSLPECTDGLGAARGWGTGEHRYLTETSLRMIGVGLPDDATQPAVLGRPDSPDSYLLDYYEDGGLVDQSGPGRLFHRMTPAGPAGMHAHNNVSAYIVPGAFNREPWLAELGELPDGSYSLADYILGNETCLPPNALLRYQPSTGGFALPRVSSLTPRDMINACHAFRSHMGALNSTHFGSQAAAMWFVHHRIALTIAGRCAAMWQSAKSTKGTALYEHFRTRLVPACEREAFAFEAVGQHYMQDAWSSGHMWERWGSPTFADNLDGQLRQSVTGAIAGMQHGWRYVAQRFTQGLSWQDSGWWIINATKAEGAQHDQLCLPGPPRTTLFTHPLAWWGAGDDLTVKYTFRDDVWPRVTQPQPAGGDLYLLACNALQPNSTTWAVAGSSNVVPVVGDAGVGRSAPDVAPGNLVRQYQRMLTCGSYSFSEVYKAGPGPDTAYRATQPVEVGPFDGALKLVRGDGFPTSFPADATDPTLAGGSLSLFHLCFGQRATNHSMVLGSGVSDWGGFDSLFSRSHVTMALLPDKTAGAAQLDDWAGKPVAGQRITPSDENTPLKKLKIDFVKDLETFTMMMAQEDRIDADGMQSAQIGLSSPNDARVATFLDQKPNQQGTSDIIQGNVRYLENPDVTKWTSAGPAGQTDDCSTHDDTYCPAKYPGTYCDRTNGYKKLVVPAAKYGDVPATVGQCVPLETAVLRGFRSAETAYWCANDTVDDMEAARATCQHAYASMSNPDAVGPSGYAECEACAEMIVPHLRASCNSNAYALVHDPRRRSTCDVLNDGHVPPLRGASLDKNTVYAQYDPASPDEALQAARYICAVTTKIPVDPPPTSASPAGTSFFRSSGGAACFTTCDTCTTCYESQVTGPLDVFTSFSDPATHLAPSYFLGGTPFSSKQLLFGAESNVVDVALASNATCAARADGSVWCAGDNSAGQLGNGDPTVKTTVAPIQVKGLTDIKHVYVAGPQTLCAVDGSGQASCWGSNAEGEVGDGTSTNRFMPVPLSLGSVQDIFPGSSGVCARSGGTISCWAGPTMAGCCRTPTPVPGVSGATQYIGRNTFLAGGTVNFWVSDDGNPVPGCADQNVMPIDVGGFGPIAELGFDGFNWCARTSAGQVSCASTIKATPGPAPCWGYDAGPPFSTTMVPAPFTANRLSVNALGISGAPSPMFALLGNQLYSRGNLSGADDTVPLTIPVLSASDAPLSCP